MNANESCADAEGMSGWSRPEGWIQEFADPWYPQFDERVNNLVTVVEGFARGHCDDARDLPTERDFIAALAAIKAARTAVRAARTAMKARA